MKLALPLSDDAVIPVYDDRNLVADLKKVLRNQLAEQITGGLSRPSKMPSVAWGISAFRCQTGSLLAENPNSTCAFCYARKGRYSFENVQAKLEERYQGLNSELWTPAMIFLINYYCDSYFRWFDSGDFASVSHVLNVNTIAKHTPEIKHWAPSREIKMIREALKKLGVFEKNLVIRPSAPLVDGPPPDFPTTSTVFTVKPQEGSFECPALPQGNKCCRCRACWNPDVKDVGYPLH